MTMTMAKKTGLVYWALAVSEHCAKSVLALSHSILTMTRQASPTIVHLYRWEGQDPQRLSDLSRALNDQVLEPGFEPDLSDSLETPLPRALGVKTLVAVVQI